MSSTLAYYLHHLNPMIFELGPIKPRWYGFAYLMGFLGAYLLIRKLCRDGMLRMNPDRVADLVLNCCIFGVLIGGRLGFVLFYDLPNSLAIHQTPLLWDFSSSFPFWGVLRVWDGGMSAHGGILFSILALAYFARRYKASFINVGDAACMVVPIGLCFGRIANFINGELYGHPSSVPWAVKFPSEVWAPTNNVATISPDNMAMLQQKVAAFLAQNPLSLTPREVQDFLSMHPDARELISAKVSGLQLSNPQHLETARHMIGNIVGSQPNQLAPGDFAHWWEHGHTALTQVMQNVFEVILPARHPSQLYEALLEGVLLFIICWTIGRLWRKDGMASGAFLTFYPMMRIIGEQFRVGDTPLDFAGLSISKGVLYSLPLVVIGACYWGYWIRRDRRFPWVPLADGSDGAVPPGPPEGAGEQGGAETENSAAPPAVADKPV
jgi:phosphatidylglycerol:prolipoprotein diacylglycerol transferase